MKKVLLFLLLLVSVQTFAQIRRTAVFDFTNPTALNPSITPEPENAQNVIKNFLDSDGNVVWAMLIFKTCLTLT